MRDIENTVSRRTAVIRTTVRTGIVAAAVIAVMSAAVQVSFAMTRAPTASVAAHQRGCCFRVIVWSEGTFKQNYGTSPHVNIGTESFSWFWKERALMEYNESSNGEPELDPARTASGHFPPVLHELSTWTSKSDEATQCYEGLECTPKPCEQTENAAAYLGHLESFGNTETVGFSAYPNVKKAFKAQKYVWGVSGGNTPGLTPCGIESDVAVGLEPPPGANDSPEQADQPFGPFRYYFTLPPRNDLRHARGARDEFGTVYFKRLSFAVSAPRPHMTEESTKCKVSFLWFPESDLEHEINDERQAEHGENAHRP